MQGDFSRWDPLRDPNRAGVLHQQGRVLLDRDWNDQARISTFWQDTAARDVIGARVAAVPSSQPLAFRVDRAEVQGGRVLVTLVPGRAWADGLMVTLPRAQGDTATPPTAVQRAATYFDASVQATPGAVSGANGIGAGVRDAVILEVWRESLSAFQLPAELLEPALGGPDTTERILTAFRLRLARLAAGEDCHTVALDDRPRGRLTASLRPATSIGGDCPVPDDGGFTGFEHQLYRVEVALVDDPGAWVKHSRFNGGLVARGLVALNGPNPQHFTLTANDLAVRTAGQTGFYLEVVRLDPQVGAWTVVYGAEVQLAGDDLNVVTPHLVPSAPFPTDADGSVFFRLWDGIRPITDFPVVATDPPGPHELESGIRLEFPDPADRYRPGDFWTFPLRAGGLANPLTLVNAAPPEGIVYHRVALAELEWPGGTPQVVTRDPHGHTIEDCRHVFRPLTDQECCCTFTVGDGVTTHGDFDDVQEAVDHLPALGGKVCLLPGLHHAAVRIVRRLGVEISGCGARTLVVPAQAADGTPTDPLFLVAGSRRVSIHDLTMVTAAGTAVRVDDREAEGAIPSAEIRVEHNRIAAGVHAVEARPRNDVGGDNDITISHNLVGLLDTPAGLAAILVSADGVMIERNRVVVVPAQDKSDPSDPRDPNTPPDPTHDPCADRYVRYRERFAMARYAHATFVYVTSVGAAPRAVYRALGGIQVAGGSERVRILENEVVGGRGHGVTLAELPGQNDGAAALDGFFITKLSGVQFRLLSQSFATTVYDVEIDRNVIRDMGMCGIGVAAFFPASIADPAGSAPGFMVRAEGLVVTRNRIERCLRDPQPVPREIRFECGLGGIALADVAGARFAENRIEENGAHTLEPVNGLFVLSGDRVEVHENAIARNGPPLGGNDRLNPGWRAGIVVVFAMARAADAFRGAAAGRDGARDGLPAVRVTGNVVSMPIGQALVVGAIGPVAITGNSLTALDIDYTAAPMSLFAGAVMVLDLGMSKDLLFTEFYFSAAGKTNYEPGATSSRNDQGGMVEALALLPSGGVLCADNQVTLDLRGRRVGDALCSVLVASMDDIGFTGNQCEVTSFRDVVMVDTLLAGVTVRAADNRWQEGITYTFYSLYAWAMMNTVTMNQSTHCLLVGAPAHRLLDFGNQVWTGTSTSPLGFRTCGRAAAVQDQSGNLANNAQA